MGSGVADQAILIGINHYPGLTDLEGPENDVKAFEAWLRSSEGGGFGTRDTITVSTSSAFGVNDETKLPDARPHSHDLNQIFRPWVEEAMAENHHDGRLFIFVAGHGFCDVGYDAKSVLHAANSSKIFAAYEDVLAHANFFRHKWLFDEIIVVMDACRSLNHVHNISPPQGLGRQNPHARASRVKFFTAFATALGGVAREQRVGGSVRGNFRARDNIS